MKTIISFLLVLFSLIALPGSAASFNGAEAEVLRDFEQILDLWRDGRYAELFEHTQVGGKQGREQFARKLASAPRKPSCCWEKMQDVRIIMKGEGAALVRARLGFDGEVPGTEYVTKGIKLKKEGGVWVISQAELYSLADLSKKGRRYRYLPARK